MNERIRWVDEDTVSVQMLDYHIDEPFLLFMDRARKAWMGVPEDRRKYVMFRAVCFDLTYRRKPTSEERAFLKSDRMKRLQASVDLAEAALAEAKKEMLAAS